MGSGMTGKLGRSWVGAWVVHGVWWCGDVVMVCCGGGKMHVCTTWIAEVGLEHWERSGW